MLENDEDGILLESDDEEVLENDEDGLLLESDDEEYEELLLLESDDEELLLTQPVNTPRYSFKSYVETLVLFEIQYKSPFVPFKSKFPAQTQLVASFSK